MLARLIYLTFAAVIGITLFRALNPADLPTTPSHPVAKPATYHYELPSLKED